MANDLTNTNRSIRFRNINILALRNPETPGPSGQFLNGMSTGGVGIGMSDRTPNLEQSLPSWTLLDQFEQPRTPQLCESIGGGYGNGTTSLPDKLIFITNDDEGNGTGGEAMAHKVTPILLISPRVGE